jgi:hypothetical protein
VPDLIRSRRAAMAVLLVVAGAGVLVTAGWLRHRAQPRPDAGVAAVTALSTPTTTATTAAPAVPVAAATLPAPSSTVRPVRVRLDRLRIVATVVPVGVDSGGNVVIPPSVSTVGWYRFGPGVGDPGSMVITGHVDSAVQGDGAFARLRDADPGDRIQVTGSDGRDAAFTVVGREEYPKSTIDLDRYFIATGPPRLTLITCGGPFDSSTGHYRDNVVVTAVPGSVSKG